MARPNDIVRHPAARSSVRSTSGQAALSATLLVLSACQSLPRGATERALYVDARKALNGESRLGWTVDRVEIADAVAQTEPSACQVSEKKRTELRNWVQAELSAQGGPAEAQYRRGKELSDLDEVIDLERTLALLQELELHLPEDCPFWVQAKDTFPGTHSTTHRFVLIAESMGAGSLLIREGQVRAGGGGSARLLLSYGLSPRLQLATGLEGGGDAVLERSDEGKLAPEGVFRFGAPMWLRWIDIDRIYDVELASITRLDDGSLKFWGGRVALAGGVTGLRRLGFMPALQVWLGYEVFPAQHDEPAQHAIRLGTRVGFDYDP